MKTTYIISIFWYFLVQNAQNRQKTSISALRSLEVNLGGFWVDFREFGASFGELRANLRRILRSLEWVWAQLGVGLGASAECFCYQNAKNTLSMCEILPKSR